MRQSFAIYSLACVILLLSSARTINACSCLGPEPPCQAFGSASAVFSGRVAEITLFTGNDKPGRNYQQKLVRFVVSQSYRGISGTSAETVTGSGGGDCGYPFKVGESYLVYASQNPRDKKLYAGICSRTRPLSEAGEDLRYLQSLATSEAGGTIYGVVNKFRRISADGHSELLGPMEGIPITIEGSDARVESITDGKGEFRVTGLPPGNYKVRLKVPEGLWPGMGEQKDGEQKTEIKDKGCAYINFVLEPNTSLSGRVLDESGGPAAKIMVDLVIASQINERYQKDHLYVHTDEQGRFEFRLLPPGEYLLGVRLNRLPESTFAYPRTFYPGTQQLASTRAIKISEGQTLEGYNIQLPQKLKPRSIEGVVVWPDGRPVPQANICFEEVEFADESICRGVVMHDEDDGRFSFTGFEGLRYLVRAHVNVGATASQRHAEPVEVPAKGSITDVRLVITEPNGSCAKCRNWTRRKSQ